MSIGNASLNEFLLGLMRTRHILMSGAFIGLFERGAGESGDWVWSDGLNASLRLWAAGEPNNWCLDEDCVTLSPVHEVGAQGKFVGLDTGWFDVSCREKRHCICQLTEGLENTVTEDFKAKEREERGRNFTGSYAQCLAATRRCWWYENEAVQFAVIVVCVPCGSVMLYVLVSTSLVFFGYKADAHRSPARDRVVVPSLYGGLLASSRAAPAEVEDLVGSWIVRGAWGSILYAVALFCLAFSTLLHMNSGISFGFAVDMLEASAMFACKTVVAVSVLLVHWHLSPLSRAVASCWVLVLGVSKSLLAGCTLMLAHGYMLAAFSGGMGSLCTWGFRFCWTLVLSCAFECLSSLALCRVQQRAAAQLCDPCAFSRVVGGSWLLLVGGTLGAGSGLGIVAALFVFDDPHDRFDPLRAFGFFYLGAALCQFLAGAGMLRANEQLRAYFASVPGGFATAACGDAGSGVELSTVTALEEAQFGTSSAAVYVLS